MSECSGWEAAGTNTNQQRQLILTIDAGGSSTRCLLARPDGVILSQSRAGPGNHILSGWDTARDSIVTAITEACKAANVGVSAVACAVAGSAGVGPNEEGSEIVSTLLSDLIPGARVHATGDMVAAFWGALDSDFGVVVAAGTGSVCYGRNPDGDSRQVGGWGQIIGDEGSAYDIAVRALRAGARATDGRGPKTALAERITQALGVDDFIGVAFRVYGEPMTRDAIAKLATTVTESASTDAVARQLLTDAGAELGLAAIAALRALGLADRDTPVAYGGAVFDAGELVLEPFLRTVRSACPRTAIVAAEFPPVIGAFKLALKELGIAFDANIAARLRATQAGDR